MAALLGRVPFLNGGLFDVHDLERANPGILIPDEAFERIFEFFDAYRWHLDERPHREDNEINPDVLGYIFEKYINQKQMGAYYTKEDITGYITRNTVIPFLMDAARKACPVAFGPGGGVWRLLADDPDRYIYPSVGHGVAWESRDAERRPARLDEPRPLPEEIAVGVEDVSLRGGWNQPAPATHALPTETWREVVARRQRHEQVRSQLAMGEVTEINDLITLNLDIERFAEDVVAQSEGPELLRAVWQAIRKVSVLDPTCGSGAFLFAALNILEPLYAACIEGMRGFVDDLEHTTRPMPPDALRDFQETLAEIGTHPSERYFVLKSIVLNNLYGVDIMDEAVEICKLRLFLKLVAQLETYDQIEPLPDIDFNIRAGNALVGFTSLNAVRTSMAATRDGQTRLLMPEDEEALASVERRAQDASGAYTHYRARQTELRGHVTYADKKALRDSLGELTDELDRYLAREYGVDAPDAGAFERWRACHQPFHWFAEFYGIMERGGFDVVVGNPPYVELRKVKEYELLGFETKRCGNLYPMVMERSKNLMRSSGFISMIVPLSGHSTKRMVPLIRSFYAGFDSLHLQTFSGDANPSRLFEGVKFRLAIFVASNTVGSGVITTRYRRWYAAERDHLFENTEYATSDNLQFAHAIPKVSAPEHLRILRQLRQTKRKRGIVHLTEQADLLYHAAPVNWIRAHTRSPHTTAKSGEMRTLTVSRGEVAGTHAILCSTTFFLWWLAQSDCYHLLHHAIDAFPMVTSARLEALSQDLERDMARKTKRRVYHYKATGRVEYDEFYMKASKPIIDKVDRELARHYGFTDEELDFIINYDIKYRMGRRG